MRVFLIITICILVVSLPLQLHAIEPAREQTGRLAEFEIVDGAIPEPSSLLVWCLLATAGISVGWWRRRRDS